MDCPNCKSPLLVESLGSGKVRCKCEKCGLSEVRDAQGRKLLTGEYQYTPPEPGVHLLLEG